jgi:hypothetical protein
MIRKVLAAAALLLAVAARAESIEDPESWSRIRFGEAVILTDAKPDRALDLVRQLTIARALLEDLIPNLPAGATRPDLYVLGRTQHSFNGLFADPAAETEAWFGGEILPGSGKQSEVYFVSIATASQVAIAARRAQTYKPRFGFQVGVYLRQVIAGGSREIPYWLREGLSARFTNFDVVGDRAQIGGVPLDVRLVLESGEIRFPMDAVFAYPRVSGAGPGSAGLVRAIGWAVVDALLQATPDGPAKLRRFVERLREGQPQRDAWLDVTGLDPQLFLEGALRRVRDGNLMTAGYPLSQFRLPTPTPAEAAPPAELFGVLAKTWIRSRPKEHAQAEQRAAAALAADPGDSRALWAMGEVRRRQGRLDEARDLAKRSRAAAGDRRGLGIEAEALEALLGAAPQP